MSTLFCLAYTGGHKQERRSDVIEEKFCGMARGRIMTCTCTGNDLFDGIVQDFFPSMLRVPLYNLRMLPLSSLRLDAISSDGTPKRDRVAFAWSHRSFVKGLVLCTWRGCC